MSYFFLLPPAPAPAPALDVPLPPFPRSPVPDGISYPSITEERRGIADKLCCHPPIAADGPLFASPAPTTAAAAAALPVETIHISEVAHPLSWQQCRNASQPHPSQREHQPRRPHRAHWRWFRSLCCMLLLYYYYLVLPLANPFFSSSRPSRPKSPRNLLPAHASLSSPTQKSHSALPSRQIRSAHPRTSGIPVTQTSTMLSTVPTLAKMQSRTLSGLSGALAAGQTISLSSQSSSALSPSSLPIPSSHTIA